MTSRGRVVTRTLATALLAAGVVAGLGALRVDDAAAPPTPPGSRVEHALTSARRIPSVIEQLAGAQLLQRDLDAVLAPYDACAAVDAPVGPVARHDADRALTPASTLKLLTGAAALATFGPDHRFVTRVATSGPVRDGVVDGDLALVGGGDPVLATPEYEAHLRETPRHRLEPVTRRTPAAAMRSARSASRVTGAVVADDSRHDPLRFLPQWKVEYFLDGDIGRLSALTVDDANASFPGETRVDDPAAHAGAELVRLLGARGIAVDGGTERGRAPDGAAELAAVESASLAEIVEAMLTSSDNQTAELLIREIGAASGDGSTPGGATATMDAIEGLGVPLAGTRIVDGSGLARENALSCATLVHVLGLRTRDDFAALDRGLAVAGRTGTLAQRLSDPAIADRLRAKTGFLDGVSGLAGVVDGPSPIEFATLVAGEFGDEGSRAVQAAVATVVAGFPSVPADLVPAP